MCVDSGVHYEPDPDDVRERGRVGGSRFRRWRRPWPPVPRGRRPRRWCGPRGGPCGSVPRCGLAAGWPPLVMGVRADSPEVSVKKSKSAGDGSGGRHGFMGR